MSTNEEQAISESSWTARGEFGMYGRHQIRVYERVARFERRCDEGWETLVEVHR
ncbi:MAG: hypothetical protein HOW73_44960, partial [Polyangiaceae bacterium]|nr:hypothetical protein [Polyangiaceae bacterium]